jgi:hypothetical protein
VSCGAVGNCVAVGTYPTTTGARQPVIESLAFGVWSATVAPLPADSTDPADATLTSILCISATHCVAVGDYNRTAHDERGLIETLSGGTWTAATDSLPPGIDGGYTTLSSVACQSATACTSAGIYNPNSQVDPVQTLVETLTDTGWAATEIPAAPTDAAAGTAGPQLYGVSCGAVGTCTAVGFYYEHVLNDGLDEAVGQGAIDELSSSGPSAIRAPLPADAETDEPSQLSAVACQSASQCVAVGSYPVGYQAGNGVIESLSNGVWSAAAAALPGDTRAGLASAGLNGVACRPDGACVAVGVYEDNQGTADPLIESRTSD